MHDIVADEEVADLEVDSHAAVGLGSMGHLGGELTEHEVDGLTIGEANFGNACGVNVLDHASEKFNDFLLVNLVEHTDSLFTFIVHLTLRLCQKVFVDNGNHGLEDAGLLGETLFAARSLIERVFHDGKAIHDGAEDG